MCVYGARNETREHTMGTKTATTSTTHDNGARRVSVRSQNIEAQLYEVRQPHSRSTHTQTQTHRSGRKPKAKRVKRKHAKKSTNTDPRPSESNAMANFHLLAKCKGALAHTMAKRNTHIHLGRIAAAAAI